MKLKKKSFKHKMEGYCGFELCAIGWANQWYLNMHSKSLNAFILGNRCSLGKRKSSLKDGLEYVV